MTDLAPMTGRGVSVYRTLQKVLRGAFRVWFRFSVEGLENVPLRGGFIVAPGAHRSILDTPVVAVAMPRVLRFMGAEKYFAIPGFGAFLTLVGGFPVERAATDREALRISAEVLGQGEGLVVFPEATRHQGPIVAPIKEGAAFLSARAQVPLLPVGIGGAERSLGIGRYLPRPTRIHVIIGAPIEPPPPGESGRVRRSLVRAHSAALAESLQVLFDRAQIMIGQ